MSDAALFGDTDDAALFGDEPKRKSKYPDPPSMSKTDAELGLQFGPADVNVPGKDQALSSGFEAAGPELSPVEKKLKGKYDNDLSFLKEAAPFALGGAIGKGAGAIIGRLATRPAAAAADEAAAAVGKAIEQSFAGKVGKLFAPQATTAATKFVTEIAPTVARGGVSTTAAGTATAARGVGAAGGSALSNAVERLRTSNSPSALDFTRRLDEAKNTPLGVVSTGTLGGGQ